MNIQKSILLLLGSILLNACVPQKKDETNKQNTLDTAEKVVLIPQINIQESNNESEKMNTIIIRNYSIAENTANVINEYINESEIPDSLFKISAIAEKFIKWYINESRPIDQEKLFTFSDSIGYYIFDTEYGEYYLKELQKTGVVSDSLISSLSNTFEQVKVDLENEKNGPERDGLINYDVDIIFNSQDLPAPFQVQEMKLVRFVIYSSANIGVMFDETGAGLINENGDWKIISGGY